LPEEPWDGHSMVLVPVAGELAFPEARVAVNEYY